MKKRHCPKNYRLIQSLGDVIRAGRKYVLEEVVDIDHNHNVEPILDRGMTHDQKAIVLECSYRGQGAPD